MKTDANDLQKTQNTERILVLKMIGFHAKRYQVLESMWCVDGVKVMSKVLPIYGLCFLFILW